MFNAEDRIRSRFGLQPTPAGSRSLSEIRQSNAIAVPESTLRKRKRSEEEDPDTHTTGAPFVTDLDKDEEDHAAYPDTCSSSSSSSSSSSLVPSTIRHAELRDAGRMETVRVLIVLEESDSEDESVPTPSGMEQLLSAHGRTLSGSSSSLSSSSSLPTPTESVPSRQATIAGEQTASEKTCQKCSSAFRVVCPNEQLIVASMTDVPMIWLCKECSRRESCTGRFARRSRTPHSERVAQARRVLGEKCTTCGHTDKLQFDCFDPDSKFANLRDATYLLDGAFWTEASKHRLLCSMCRLARRGSKTLIYQTPPSDTLSIRQRENVEHMSRIKLARTKCHTSTCTRLTADFPPWCFSFVQRMSIARVVVHSDTSLSHSIRPSLDLCLASSFLFCLPCIKSKEPHSLSL